MVSRRLAVVFLLLVFARPTFAYRISSWISGWDPNALTSTQTNAGRMSESNPCWYAVNADGTLAKKTNAENPTWRAAMTGTFVMPTVQNTTLNGFDKTLAVNLLATAASREAHAEAIRQVAFTQGYDGIDIDYERLPLSSRDNFTAFVTLLASKLHADGKKLSVTVYAKTNDSENWDGPGGEDYAAIGAVADWVKLMLYDYSWSTSAAGPITPLGWLDECLAFAASQIPRNKIMAGLPWYGYDWVGTSGVTVTYQEATNNARANAATIIYDANGEAVYNYGTHKVYFVDSPSHDKKVDLILQKYAGIAGFSYWRNGSEDPAVWTRVAALLATSPAVPPPPPPPAPMPDANPVSGGTFIARGSAWRYLDNGSDAGTAWRSTLFNDGSWKTGAAELGYGDGDEKTAISYGSNASSKFTTTYFRYSFNLDNPLQYTALKVRMKRDDGGIVYLNGTEVFRSNMPAGTVGYRTFALPASDESTYFEASIAPNLLVAGRNVLAVEIHQADLTSSDVSFDADLLATLPVVAPPPPPPTPSPVTGTIVPFGSTWKYLDNGSDQGTAWRATTFVDSAWKTGVGQFGYGDGDEKTRVSYGSSSSTKYITTYYRRAFNVTDPAAVRSLLVRMIRDDGAVVYVNGVEVWRSNMPTGAIGYKTLAAVGVAGSDESKIFESTIASSMLVAGTNVITVEVHQDLASSSDTSFDLELVAR